MIARRNLCVPQARRRPDVAHRVVLFPLAVGDAPLRSQMLVPRGNLGNTMLATRASSIPTNLLKSLQGSRRLEAIVLPLERLFPAGFGATRLVKVDTQGFECKVLQGSMRTLRHARSRMEVLAVEDARQHLAAHCCTPTVLTHLMRAIGEPAAVEGSTSTLGDSKATRRARARPWLPYSAAVGLYAQAHKLAPPTSAHAWNVSCNARKSDESTCIARPWNVTRGGPAPYQLWFEEEVKPPQRRHVNNYMEWGQKCESRGLS